MKKIKNVLNLDSDGSFHTKGRLIGYNAFRFNGGEMHVRINQDQDIPNGRVLITNRIKDSDDIMKIALAVDALRRMGLTQLSLFIPYIPYARQDRVANVGECFSLKVFANIINSLGFDKVYGLDAHSDVTAALINNFVNINPHHYINNALRAMGISPVLVSPDAGANKKTQAFRDTYASVKNLDIVYCNKTRNTATGKLNNFEVFTEDLTGANCLIIDDICDGGRTFIEISRLLKLKGACSVSLYTTHGIYSQGIQALTNHLDRIYCTNSFNSIQPSLPNRQFNKLVIDGTLLLETIGERFDD